MPSHVFIACCLFMHSDNFYFMTTVGSVRGNKTVGASGFSPLNNTEVKNALLSLYLRGKAPAGGQLGRTASLVAANNKFLDPAGNPATIPRSSSLQGSYKTDLLMVATFSGTLPTAFYQTPRHHVTGRYNPLCYLPRPRWMVSDLPGDQQRQTSYIWASSQVRFSFPTCF